MYQIYTWCIHTYTCVRAFVYYKKSPDCINCHGRCDHIVDIAKVKKKKKKKRNDGSTS